MPICNLFFIFSMFKRNLNNLESFPRTYGRFSGGIFNPCHVFPEFLAEQNHIGAVEHNICPFFHVPNLPVESDGK